MPTTNANNPSSPKRNVALSAGTAGEGGRGGDDCHYHRDDHPSWKHWYLFWKLWWKD